MKAKLGTVPRSGAGTGVKITMTLTTIGCPLFNLIEQEAKIKLKELGIDENNIEFDLTFDPPWSMEKMSERAKAMLGI
jgi:metal-sulfur cluster biosynthetic enzyme